VMAARTPRQIVAKPVILSAFRQTPSTSMPRPVLLVLLCLCLTVHTAGALWAQTAFPVADTPTAADMHACCPDDAQPSPLAAECNEATSCCMHANPLLAPPAAPALAQLAHSPELPAWRFSAHGVRDIPQTRPPIGG